MKPDYSTSCDSRNKEYDHVSLLLSYLSADKDKIYLILHVCIYTTSHQIQFFFLYVGALGLHVLGRISSQGPDHCNAILCLQIPNKFVTHEMKLCL